MINYYAIFYLLYITSILRMAISGQSLMQNVSTRLLQTFVVPLTDESELLSRCKQTTNLSWHPDSSQTSHQTSNLKQSQMTHTTSRPNVCIPSPTSSTLAPTDHLAIALNLTEKDKYFRKPLTLYLCNERSPRVLEIPGIATVTAFLIIEASNRAYQCMKLEFGFLVRSFAQSVVDTIYEES